VNFDYSKVVKEVEKTLIKASTTFRPDQKQAYRLAIKGEQNPNARWVMETILENAIIAEKEKLPLCDDTGVPHVFLEVGYDVAIPAGFFSAVKEGVAKGLHDLPGRPMAVIGNDIQRITQEAGLSDKPEDLAIAPIQIRIAKGDKIKLTVLMLGGGPEIRGKTQRVFHRHSLDVVIKEMVKWAKEGMAKLGCLPGVLGLGIGRTNIEAASLCLEAMKDGNFLIQNDLEKRVTKAVNMLGIGPLGVGGTNTVLATFIKIGPQRASGVRIVSLRAGCCFDPRRASIFF